MVHAVETHAQTTARAESVVSPAWVKTLIDFHAPGSVRPRPPGYRHNHFIILEASWAKPAEANDYLAGHVPGALHLNTDELENGYPRWLLCKPQELQCVIGALGITPATTVVVYGKQMIAAARVWWALQYAGVADVRLLNGGLAAWVAAGYPAETTIDHPRPVAFAARVRDKWLATTPYIRARLNDPQTLLADVRSREEYTGASSGYDYLNFKGHIPSAIHLGNADDAACLYLNADGTLRDARDVLALWQSAGLANDGREVVFYCGSGWRSSLAFLYAWRLGFDKIRNYSDGWGGWSTVYTPDPQAQGNTPGWRQRRSANPC